MSRRSQRRPSACSGRPPDRALFRPLAEFQTQGAYRVAAEVRAKREARGERPIGRKIGFTNRTFGPIPTCMLRSGDMSTTARSMTCRREYGPLLEGLAEPRIEPEIVFGLAAAPAPGMDERALLGCIDWIAHQFRDRAVDLPRLGVCRPRHCSGLRPPRRAMNWAAAFDGLSRRPLGARALRL